MSVCIGQFQHVPDQPAESSGITDSQAMKLLEYFC